MTLGQALGLGDDELAALERGGYLHDVGKIGVPDAILLKTGPLTADEFGRMKAHTTIGETLCGELRSLRAVRSIVRHHHERLDGSGYPDGLRGDAIPLMAQIVGIVDAYDAMTTTRPYRKARSQAEAFAGLRDDVQRGAFDRALVELFIELNPTAPVEHDIALRFAGHDAIHPERVRHPAGGDRRDT